MDALVRRRDELQAEHGEAVVLLENAVAAGAAGSEIEAKRRACTPLYDALAGVQREIDDRLARERKR
jgi:hypothetical protein